MQDLTRVAPRLERLSASARRGRRVPPAKSELRPLRVPTAKRPRNRTAKLVFLLGLAIAEISFYPGWPDLGHGARVFLVLGIAFPGLLVGFRALGRALAGASGLTCAGIGIALCLSPPLAFALH